MEILYKKEKEEADQMLEQQRLVSPNKLDINQTHFLSFMDSVFCVSSPRKLQSGFNRY